MKSLYLLLFVVGLIWIVLGQIVTFATPRDEGLAIQLNREPANWEVRITEDSFFLKKSEEKTYNEELRAFILKNRYASEDKRQIIDVAVGIGCIFCAIGWLRERNHEKKKGA